MITYTTTETITKPRLVIKYDDYDISPRDWDNIGYFITQSGKFESPDGKAEPTIQRIVEETGERAGNLDEHIKLMEEAIKDETDEQIIGIYPVNRFEHTNVHYSLGVKYGFDFSNCGFYIVTDKSLKAIGTATQDITKVIDGELEIYNKWANGEVYRFTLYGKDGEYEDSCGGFYALEEIMEYLPAEFKDEDLSQYLVSN